MPLIRPSDPDFRVCRIGFGALLEIQVAAENSGLATRWTSVAALRSQVREAPILLQSLMREERRGTVRAYRCLVLFSAVQGGDAGGVATIDLTPERFASLDRADLEPVAQQVLAGVFSLAVGGISMVSKR